jgi:hypothetical protein
MDRIQLSTDLLLTFQNKQLGAPKLLLSYVDDLPVPLNP